MMVLSMIPINCSSKSYLNPVVLLFCLFVLPFAALKIYLSQSDTQANKIRK